MHSHNRARRHELPTDDQQYERRKEREREEAEERRGAENAVSHNEFLVRGGGTLASVVFAGGWHTEFLVRSD